MGKQKYTVGLDYGTESARAVLVDIATGREVATSIYRYPHGVIDEVLPTAGPEIRLPPDWALQDPEDYLAALRTAVPDVIGSSQVDPADVIGIGVDFTSCTMLPCTADGTPLSLVPDFRHEPHAWVKLWKHHAAQPQADRINELARRRGEPWLPRYGGKISSEWFFAKSLQILEEAPAIYAAADRFIEAADWIVWQLTGIESRNACTAGYKAIWSKRDGFVDQDFLAALDPRFGTVVDEKMSRQLLPVGARAGGLSEEAAAWTGLRPGIAVAAANVDAHVSVPAVTVTEPGRLVAIMGTSTCHVLLGDHEADVEGMCGVVEDGVIPGLFGYEAGQAAVGDIFGWFVEHAVPPEYHERAAARGIEVHALLESEAARLVPGESGLIALDWWNGNRSVLVDVDLTGLLLGATLSTRPPEIYRALLEATAFGTRMIVEAFRSGGVRVDEIVACGGLPGKNRLMMQIYADVTGLDIRTAASSQAPALGSAMFAAVAAGRAAGGHDSIFDAVRAMAHIGPDVYRPRPDAQEVYAELYSEYRTLHDLFGRDGVQVMKTLKRIRERVLGRAAPISAQV